MNFKEPEGQMARWLDKYKNMIMKSNTALEESTQMLMPSQGFPANSAVTNLAILLIS